MTIDTKSLVIAGPILRQVGPKRFCCWIATRAPVAIAVTFKSTTSFELKVDPTTLSRSTRTLRAAQHLHYQLIDLHLVDEFPQQQAIFYDLQLKTNDSSDWKGHQNWASCLVYEHQNLPFFIVNPQVSNILHGSCRKPHFDSPDGLVRADQWLSQQQHGDWPSLLMMSGDQVYVDDVATPMLVAIHQLIASLGFNPEQFSQANIKDCSQLHSKHQHYMSREQLLPDIESNQGMLNVLFKGVKKPVFTSDSAHNHLISLAEMLSMYLLVWSPEAWRDIDMPMPSGLNPKQQLEFEAQLQIIENFKSQLAKVQRLLAHLPTAMMFDDHDVTDDWNLTAAWEETAYGHPFSERILGNALLAYLINQGWGNEPDHFPESLLDRVQHVLDAPGDERHQQLLSDLQRFHQWGYQWQTQPPLLVLDTRTHRWRSERNFNKPSGLMDWESLTDLQQSLLGQNAVIMVSPAPVFGVKLIESIQALMTFFGKPLMVDAENWMAHPGSASALMNLFRHPKTPKHFVILSGDVHYSFAYSVELRGRRGGPDIWQVTSSGLKNQFPTRLLDVLDRLNRWLFSPRSPLNLFTRRRQMRIIPHKPIGSDAGERLVNCSGIGLLQLREDGSVKKIVQLGADGSTIEFELDEDQARWE
ncbi:alkaline phosphatase family protein [Alginatibacterium sediminis]|uniref:Alkaline phosphatase family protein n=2 Tax=Alginatibacterium sediminis TaxID=2164068 RepID=A0A420EGC4_9ALTE|nr:alkaline phosphatase family protein [Alginatibacterium sediminis]